MNPLYQRAAFLIAAARLDQAPPDEGKEVAFAGRSNAGKSSAINVLCHQRHLARTSKTPGRTQQLIFFNLGDGRRLVDLPGYGYAKVSEGVKRQWQSLMTEYLHRRRSLAGLVLVMDVRHPLTAFDRQLLAWSSESRLPVLVLLTKADKLKRAASLAQLDVVRKAVAQQGAGVEVALFSALQPQGIEEVQAILDRWLGVGSQSVPDSAITRAKTQRTPSKTK
jgi:GTP-binding protein